MRNCRLLVPERFGESGRPLTSLDLTGAFRQLGSATPVFLGSGGFSTLRYRFQGPDLIGWMEAMFMPDATFPNTGFPIYLDPLSLPTIPRASTFGEPGEFGFVNNVGLEGVGIATSSADFGGGLPITAVTFFKVERGAGGLDSVMSDTNPTPIPGATAVIVQARLHYEKA